MACIDVTTQADFDAALARGDCIHVSTGEWQAFDSATVRAFGSATVRAFGSATVRASGSATVRAFDSATVRAFGSATVRAFDSATVEASKYVAVTIHGEAVEAKGGVHVRIPAIDSVDAWCDFYGLSVMDGIVVLYKALDADFRSPHGVVYTPGTTPVAPDWDGGSAECGGGLHFSPRPFMALKFAPEAKRFVACPVAVAEIRSPRPGDAYPEKVKAPRCVGPVYEVTIDGEPVVAAATTEAVQS